MCKDEQEYLVNTPILVTRLYDRNGACIEVTDFAPRFRQHGRMFCPMMLVRQIKRIAGNPRIRVRLRPAQRVRPPPPGDHLRQQSHPVRRRRSRAAPDHRCFHYRGCWRRAPFFLEDAVTLLLGPDETVQGGVAEVGRHFLEETASVLARVGALACHPLRMAGRGHPRRDHAQAERLRGHRSHRRGDDDLDSRGTGQRPELGLPLLLAARRVLRGERA